jgi:hypothetical protein
MEKHESHEARPFVGAKSLNGLAKRKINDTIDFPYIESRVPSTEYTSRELAGLQSIPDHKLIALATAGPPWLPRATKLNRISRLLRFDVAGFPL